jgi:hypothetical protein
MATLTELQAQLEQLKRARNSGVLSIRKGDDSTTFRSLAEMNQAIAALEGEIAQASGTTGRVRMVRFNDRSGW